MFYNSLELKQFRSYKQYAAEFSDGVNIIVGPNASGKTNLLEAILFISKGKSYRAKDADLIMFDKNWASLKAILNDNHTRDVYLKNENSKLDKNFEIDENKIKRLTINKKVPIVLFEPDNLRLISGSPERRRNYIDDLLEQTMPGYSSTLRKYKRALSQRNRLLKNENINNDSLFVWNLKLAEYGSQIAIARMDIVKRINGLATEIYSSLGPKNSKVEVSYNSKISLKDYSSDLLKKLETHQKVDIERGFTSFGPHRDDIIVELDSFLADVAASRGESRTLVLMFKIVELKLQEEFYGSKPVFLLDDVFSELDSKRRRALTDYLEGYQSIITTTDADAILEGFTDYSIIPLVKD